jgi:hypothetical protein
MNLLAPLLCYYGSSLLKKLCVFRLRNKKEDNMWGSE